LFSLLSKNNYALVYKLGANLHSTIYELKMRVSQKAIGPAQPGRPFAGLTAITRNNNHRQNPVPFALAPLT
jgi:hypothetical protein